jgi:hypothetical protein
MPATWHGRRERTVASLLKATQARVADTLGVRAQETPIATLSASVLTAMCRMRPGQMDPERW